MQTRKLNQESAVQASAQEFGGEQHIDLFAVSAQATQAADIEVDIDVAKSKARSYESGIVHVRDIDLQLELCGADEIVAEDAFNVLFKHYYKDAVGLANFYLRDYQEAEDVVLEAFAGIWDTRETIKWEERNGIPSQDRFWLYLKQCFMNGVRNIVRKRKTRQTDAMDMTCTEAVELVSREPHTSPEKGALDNEVSAAVADAVSRLKDIEQDALRMQSDEVSIADIAKAIDKTPNRVKSLLSNAKKKVRADLSERYPDIFGEDAE